VVQPGEHPDMQVECCVDYALTDIAAQRFDAGVRLGTSIDKDMIAVRIAPDMRMAVAGSPDYLAGRPIPATPRDLIGHRCINLRLATHGGLYAWESRRTESRSTCACKVRRCSTIPS
jgi:DNA-binding transcriptional LysR family regulator